MEEFYFIVIILYLFDSIVWIKNGSIGLHSFFGNNYCVKNQGFHILNFLPTTQYFKLENPQFILQQDGLFVLKSLNKFENKYLIDSDFKYFPYSDVKNVSMSGGALVINSDYSIIIQTNFVLKKLYQTISSIIQSNPNNRSELIKHHYTLYQNKNNIKSQLNKLQKSLMILEPLGTIFFMLLFVIFPLVFFDIITLKLSIFNISLVLGFIQSLVVGIVLFLYFKFSFENFTLSYLIPILLYPISSAHLASNLFRNIYSNYEPLTVMSELLNDNDFVKVAKNEFNKNKIVIDLCTNNNYKNYVISKNENIKSLFLEKKISLEKLNSDIKQFDASSLSFCPVCECEYLIKDGLCSDCNISLKQFKVSS